MPLWYHKGDAFGFIYNGEEYYYIKNVQYDIVAIADKNGDIVANYYYDALIGGVAGGGYGYNKAVKSYIPKGQRWRYVFCKANMHEDESLEMLLGKMLKV